jgi:hypothetical protein
MRVELEALEDHADFFPKLVKIDLGVVQRGAVHNDFTLLVRLQSVDAAQQRAFAGTAGAADDHGLAHFYGFHRHPGARESHQPFVDFLISIIGCWPFCFVSSKCRLI